MRIGCPKELRIMESRVALIPSRKGAAELRDAGHQVRVQRSAGQGGGFLNTDYETAGAKLSTQRKVWEDSDLIVKVKEPLPEEFRHFQYGKIVFGFLHLAANRPLLSALVNGGVTAIDYGTISLPDGSRPILAAMSRIAGEIAHDVGANLVAKNKGMLASQASVLVMGAGNAGSACADLFLKRGSRVLIVDTDPSKLKAFKEEHRRFLPYELWCMTDKEANLAGILPHIDVLVGAAHAEGVRADKLVSRDMIKSMRSGSVAIDISIDMGGCFETSRETTLAHPTYVMDGVTHYCVANMPGSVPNSSTKILCGLTFPYLSELANKGFEQAMRENPALARGVNIYKGEVTHKGLADSVGKKYTPLSDLLWGVRNEI